MLSHTGVQPVHCIVWAKELPFQKLFGDKSTPSDLDTVPSSTAPATAREAQTEGEAGAKAEVAPDFFAPREGESLDAFGRRVFDRLFGENVAETLKMDDMWRHRARPTPHFLDDVLRDAPGAPAADSSPGTPAQGEAAASAAAASGAEDPDGVPAAAAAEAADGPAGSAVHRLGLTDEHAVWSLQENARLFLECIRAFFETRQQVHHGAAPVKVPL